jgi:hypothetical protein
MTARHIIAQLLSPVQCSLGSIGERTFHRYVRFAIPMKISFDMMRRSLPNGSIP